jgi:hypothetical protein
MLKVYNRHGKALGAVEYRLGERSTGTRTTETGDLELENWVRIPRRMNKKWREDFIVI